MHPATSRIYAPIPTGELPSRSEAATLDRLKLKHSRPLKLTRTATTVHLSEQARSALAQSAADRGMTLPKECERRLVASLASAAGLDESLAAAFGPRTAATIGLLAETLRAFEAELQAKRPSHLTRFDDQPIASRAVQP